MDWLLLPSFFGEMWGFALLGGQIYSTSLVASRPIDFVVECPGDGFGGQIYVMCFFLMTSSNRASRKTFWLHAITKTFNAGKIPITDLVNSREQKREKV